MTSNPEIVHGVRCGYCSSIIWSRHTHDMQYCDCGLTFVDGGRSYMRYGAEVQTVPGPDGSIVEYTRHPVAILVDTNTGKQAYPEETSSGTQK